MNKLIKITLLLVSLITYKISATQLKMTKRAFINEIETTTQALNTNKNTKLKDYLNLLNNIHSFYLTADLEEKYPIQIIEISLVKNLKQYLKKNFTRENESLISIILECMYGIPLVD